MPLMRYLDDVVAWAPAKVNLFLEVLAKRPDGYHDIATLMVAVSLYDTIVFRDEPGGSLHLECYQTRLSTGADNLVMRAARLLQERTHCGRGCRIRLVKRIPIGAGLGGGSSDAAATLLGLNRLWQLGLSRDELAALAGELGSDVAFFLYTPAAWCTGRGEKVERQPLPQTLNLVLVCPHFPIATADVYRQVRVPAAPRSGDELRRAVTSGQVQACGPLLFNRLEAVAETLEPRCAKYHRWLRDLGPAGHLLSGSGSSLFALTASADEAARLATALTAAVTDASVFQVRSCA